MSELTVYTSTSDGYMQVHSAVGYSYVHNLSVGAVHNTEYNSVIGQYFQPVTDEYYIWRSFLFFDTSGLPGDATITEVTLSIYIGSNYSDTDFDIVVRNGQSTYPHDPLESGDYLYSHYSGDGGSFNTSGITTTKYYDITLNSTGIGWINRVGTTKLALISQRDIDSTVPSQGVGEYVTINTKEAGDEYRARLVITYTYSSVTTYVPTNIIRADPTVVTADGLIENIGVYDITTRGFEYGLTETPTWSEYEEGTFTEGTFSLQLMGLTEDTTYYIRAYATVAEETRYGSYVEFKTTYPYGSFKTVIEAEATASSGDIDLVGGKRSLTIENHLIQNQTIADLISAAYLDEHKDQKMKLVVTKPTPAPYTIGDTITRGGILPYYAAVSALISYAPAASAEHPYSLADRDMLIRKLNVSFSAGNYISVIELESS